MKANICSSFPYKLRLCFSSTLRGQKQAGVWQLRPTKRSPHHINIYRYMAASLRTDFTSWVVMVLGQKFTKILWESDPPIEVNIGVQEEGEDEEKLR